MPVGRGPPPRPGFPARRAKRTRPTVMGIPGESTLRRGRLNHPSAYIPGVARVGVLGASAVFVVGCARVVATPSGPATASTTELRVVEPPGPIETFADPQ